MICENISVSKDGKHLLFAGQDTVELAKKYGTPVYLLDEDRIGKSAEYIRLPSKSTLAKRQSHYMHQRQTASSACTR